MRKNVISFLACTFMFTAALFSPLKVRADGTDAAILMQQILQFLQDYDMDSGGLLSSFSDEDGGNTYGVLKRILEMNEERMRETSDVAERFVSNPTMRVSVGKLNTAMGRIFSTCHELIETAEYVQEYGSAEDFQAILALERQFRFVAINSVRNASEAVYTFKSMRQSDGLDIYNSVNNATQGCLNHIELMSSSVMSSVSSITDNIYYKRFSLENSRSRGFYFY